MATDLTLVELKNILRAHGAAITGNKAELITRMEQMDPEGAWLAEFKKSQETNDPARGPPGGDTTIMETSVNEAAELRQLLASMQAQISALSLQLQQKVSASTSSCPSGTSRDGESNLQSHQHLCMWRQLNLTKERHWCQLIPPLEKRLQGCTHNPGITERLRV